MMPLLAGLLCGLLVLLIGFVTWLVLKRRKALQSYSFGVITAVVFLLAGMFFSPTVALGGGFNQWECNMDVIKTYEQSGQFLAHNLSKNDLIYWAGGNAVAALLYVPEVKIFPQQLDDQWNYFYWG